LSVEYSASAPRGESLRAIADSLNPDNVPVI
jgi:hypothetical protein